MQNRKWKKVLAVLLCAASVLGQVIPVAAQETVSVEDVLVETQEDFTEITAEEVETTEQNPTENVALGKTAIASSEEADSVRASNAVDGNTTDRGSRWGSNTGAGPHWIYVDLGEIKDVQTVGLYWENRKATSYAIQIAQTLSNTMAEGDWTTVKEFNTRPVGLVDEIVFDEVKQAR